METRTIAVEATHICEIRIPKDDVMLYPNECAKFVKELIAQAYGEVNIDFTNNTIAFVNDDCFVQQYVAEFVQAPSDRDIVIGITFLEFGEACE